MSATVKEEVCGQVLAITIDRPGRLNTIDQQTAEGLGEAVDRLERSPDLRAGVLTGAGGCFCAGLDLKAVGERGPEGIASSLGEVAHVPERGFAGITRKPPEKPVLAAVEGPAVAGGLEIALSCDLIVAGAGARFGITEVRVGLIAGAGGLLRLAERVPRGAALEMAMTGDLVPAERALAIGLADRVVEEGEAVGAALEIAERIAEASPLAVRRSKWILERAASWPPEERWARQQPALDEVFGSEDAREGITAFLEHRPPRWSGR